MSGSIGNIAACCLPTSSGGRGGQSYSVIGDVECASCMTVIGMQGIDISFNQSFVANNNANF